MSGIVAARNYDAGLSGQRITAAPVPGSGRQPPGGSWNLAAFERHRAAYLASARRILGCPAQAEDVVQDVLLRLIADPPEAADAVQAAYVGRMVRNLALDRARRRGFERRLFTGLDAAPDPADPGMGTPEAAAASRESLRQVEAAVAELPEPVRTAFQLHRVEGVPQIEMRPGSGSHVPWCAASCAAATCIASRPSTGAAPPVRRAPTHHASISAKPIPSARNSAATRLASTPV